MNVVVSDFEQSCLKSTLKCRPSGIKYLGNQTQLKELDPSTTSGITTIHHLADFLRKNQWDGIQQLARKFKLKVAQHSQCPDVVHVSRTESTPIESNVEVFEYGVIMDKKNNEIVAFGLPTMDDTHRNKKSSSEVVVGELVDVYEHIDGYMCLLYSYQGKWFVASNYDADGKIVMFAKSKMKQTLAELFWGLFKNGNSWQNQSSNNDNNNRFGFNLPDSNYQYYCFTFMLTTNRQRIFVKHDDKPNCMANLYLIAVRNMKTLEEKPIEDFENLFGWNIPCKMKLDNTLIQKQNVWNEKMHQHLRHYVDCSINPFQTKGYIVLLRHNNQFIRKSYISQQWIAGTICLSLQNEGFGPFNLSADHLSETEMKELIVRRQTQKLIEYFPKWIELCSPLMIKVCIFLPPIEQ